MLTFVHTKSSAIALALVLLFFSYFGIFFCSQMNMPFGHEVAAMVSDCAGASTHGQSCPMNLEQHLFNWAQLIVANVEHAFSFLIVVVSMLALVCLFNCAPLVEYVRVYLRNHQRYRLYNYFVRLLARGIIQPKLFA